MLFVEERIRRIAARSGCSKYQPNLPLLTILDKPVAKNAWRIRGKKYFAGNLRVIDLPLELAHFERLLLHLAGALGEGIAGGTERKELRNGGKRRGAADGLEKPAA